MSEWYTKMSKRLDKSHAKEKTICLHPVSITSVHRDFAKITKTAARQATHAKAPVPYVVYPKPVYTISQKRNQTPNKKKEKQTYVKIYQRIKNQWKY